MRILILSHFYAPEPIPKPSELAVELARRGHEVSVVTGFPNYPSGRLYDGYRLRLVRRERLDGVTIARTFVVPYHGTNVIGRILNYASFMLSAPLGAALLGGFDVIYVWHPPLTVGVAAWVIGRLTGAPFVYDVQDIWPEAAVLSGLLRPGRLVRFLSRLERFVYRRAAHLLVVTDGARANLMAKGVDPGKVSVLPNWIDESAFAPADPDAAAEIRRRYAGDRFLLLFAGNLGLVQGLDTVLHAARELQDRRVRIGLLGDGADRGRLEERARALGLTDTVVFIDRQPATRVPAFLAAADALLVHLRRSELSRYVIPTKTLAYLASGRPILMAMEGAAADLVADAGAGLLVRPEDPEALAAAIRDLSARPEAERLEMGRRGRAYARDRLTGTHVVPRYEEILARVARAHEPGAAGVLSR